MPGSGRRARCERRPDRSQGAPIDRRLIGVLRLDLDQRVTDLEPAGKDAESSRPGSIRLPSARRMVTFVLKFCRSNAVFLELLEVKLIGGDGRVLKHATGDFPLGTATEFERSLAMEKAFALCPAAHENP